MPPKHRVSVHLNRGTDAHTACWLGVMGSPAPMAQRTGTQMTARVKSNPLSTRIPQQLTLGALGGTEIRSNQCDATILLKRDL